MLGPSPQLWQRRVSSPSTTTTQHTWGTLCLYFRVVGRRSSPNRWYGWSKKKSRCRFCGTPASWKPAGPYSDRVVLIETATGKRHWCDKYEPPKKYANPVTRKEVNG
jgi:hypothetical protein